MLVAVGGHRANSPGGEFVPADLDRVFSPLIFVVFGCFVGTSSDSLRLRAKRTHNLHILNSDTSTIALSKDTDPSVEVHP